MKFRLTVLIVFSLCLSNVFADEGMWLLGNLRKNKQTDRVMKELGLQMPVNKIYNPKKPSLSDAVVSFGGFCSGVVVSEDGLVFTNHHCGFSSIQQHSSVEHDYLKDGFFARSLDEELPNPELYVRFLLRTEDVTKRVLSAARYAKTETERRVAVDSIMNVIGLEVSEKDSTLTGIVDAYYAGNEFWLSVYRDYNDVRLVFAPPSSVGKFGWDTDNWMWPRHTGDFSVFRIYANTKNGPADYSPDNVPYHPEYVAPISLDGYKEGLWWRDHNFDPPYKEPNGKNCYWSRGNGWVYAALVRVMNEIPSDEKHRQDYINDFLTMSKALKQCQREDGFWNVSLHDPSNFGGKETSGTALFVYGMAWGIRNGLLDKKTYLPVIIKAWNAMVKDAVHPNGFLGYVQGTGKEPKDSQPVTYDKVPDFEDFGTGCFLLAGSEIYKLDLNM